MFIYLFIKRNRSPPPPSIAYEQKKNLKIDNAASGLFPFHVCYSKRALKAKKKSKKILIFPHDYNIMDEYSPTNVFCGFHTIIKKITIMHYAIWCHKYTTKKNTSLRYSWPHPRCAKISDRPWNDFTQLNESSFPIPLPKIKIIFIIHVPFLHVDLLSLSDSSLKVVTIFYKKLPKSTYLGFSFCKNNPKILRRFQCNAWRSVKIRD